MYYYLKGTIVEQGENYIVIDVCGIGYQVLVMHPLDFPLFELCLVYIAHIVREDEEYFVGFKDLQEKKVFNQLISVKGIGPRTALTALRGISIDEFIACIQNEDIKRLKKLEGIGPKAASQIILDLKGSLSDFGVVASKNTKKGGRIMRNTLGDLNLHLFAQLERLSDEDITGEKLQEEINRSRAISSVAKEIIANADLVLQAKKFSNEYMLDDDMPKLLEG